MQKSSRQQSGQQREGQNRAHDAPRPVDKRVQHRIQDWKRKLVDLSRRNRLIFFRPSRTSSLQVLEPPAHELFEHLAIRERAWCQSASKTDPPSAANTDPPWIGQISSCWSLNPPSWASSFRF